MDTNDMASALARAMGACAAKGCVSTPIGIMAPNLVPLPVLTHHWHHINTPGNRRGAVADDSSDEDDDWGEGGGGGEWDEGGGEWEDDGGW